jgi:hypothetical protein
MARVLSGIRRGRLKYLTALVASFIWPTVWGLHVIERCERED